MFAMKTSILQNFKRALRNYDKGNLRKAKSICKDVLSADPKHVGCLHMLGAIHYQQDQMLEALHFAMEALNVQPTNLSILSGLGLIHAKLGQYAEALVYYDKVLDVWPNHSETLNNRGNALMGLRRTAEALASYDKAIALCADYPSAHYNKGNALSEIGQFDAASQALETAIKLAPRTARFYRALLEGRRATPGDPYLQALEDLLQGAASLDPDEQIDLHFGLAKAYADLGDHERSFRRLMDGNALKRKHVVYDEKANFEIFEQTRAAFTHELMGMNKGLSESSANPIFIVGMPRSGSSLIEQILASHPQVFGAGEIDDFGKAIISVTGFAEAIDSPAYLSRLPREKLLQIGANYLDRTRSLAPDAGRITDKMLLNFRFVGLIHMALPNARIIHTVRDPMDTCLSCFSNLFAGKSQPYAYDLSELGRYYRAYESMMTHWRTVLPSNVMLDVQYEGVIADFEGQVRRLIAYCGLDWEPRCLDFHKTQRQVRTASREQVRQPLYQRSVGRWRPFEPFLGPLLAALQTERHCSDNKGHNGDKALALSTSNGRTTVSHRACGLSQANMRLR